MEATTYQVELRNPNGGREDYWGVAQGHFTSKRDAIQTAKEDCPDGWEWRVVRVRLDVAAEGVAAAKAA